MIKSEIKWTTSIRGNVILHDGGRASPLIWKKLRCQSSLHMRIIMTQVF